MGGGKYVVAVDERCRPSGGQVVRQREDVVGNLDFLGDFDYDTWTRDRISVNTQMSCGDSRKATKPILVVHMRFVCQMIRANTSLII